MSKHASYREVVFQLIDEERERQIELGKSDNNPWALWLMILGDYVGRISNTLWKLTTGDKDTTGDDLLKDLVRALAIGVAWSEHIILHSINIEEDDLGDITIQEEKTR